MTSMTPANPTSESARKEFDKKIERERIAKIQLALNIAGLASMVLTTATALAFWLDWRAPRIPLVVSSVLSLEALVVLVVLRSSAVRVALKLIAGALAALFLVGIALAEFSLLTDKPKRYLQLVSELNNVFRNSAKPGTDSTSGTKMCVQFSIDKGKTAGE
jgi:lysylphosphatidylglycerol synthetase-like protein (DUF2156 family)